MTEERSHYALYGGKAGYDRLLVLARDRGPDTAAFLDRAGVGAGMRIVDVGCGGGEVSFELARRAGPTGSVVGLDLDEVKLELARGAAREREITNVEFRRASAGEWVEPSTY